MGSIIKNGVEYTFGSDILYNMIESGGSVQDLSVIANAITEMGVATSNSATPEEMARNIRQIVSKFSDAIGSDNLLAMDYAGSFAENSPNVTKEYTATEDCYVMVLLSAYYHNQGFSGEKCELYLSGGTIIIDTNKQNTYSSSYRLALVKLEKDATLTMRSRNNGDVAYSSREVAYIAFSTNAILGTSNSVDLSPIAEAITEKGVTTSSDATVEEMAENIRNISVGSTIINLGSAQSFDVSSYEGYKNFTEDNFIIETDYTTSYSGSGTSNSTISGNWDSSDTDYAYVYAWHIKKKTYDPSTGILTAYIEIGIRGTSTGHSLSYKSTKKPVKAYLVY